MLGIFVTLQKGGRHQPLCLAIEIQYFKTLIVTKHSFYQLFVDLGFITHNDDIIQFFSSKETSTTYGGV